MARRKFYLWENNEWSICNPHPGQVEDESEIQSHAAPNLGTVDPPTN